MAYILEIEFFNTFVVKGPSDAYHVEESRIRGDYNETSVDIGVKAHVTDSEYAQETRENTMIWSGIYNNRTRTNQLNQFSIGEEITKSVDIQDGSIQLLFAEDTNLEIYQEENISYALIDKDAVYTAEGDRLTTTRGRVLGDIRSYTGNYGIGLHPESFAHFAGRRYFVDKQKGIVCRLSRDGITEISGYGMRDYFLRNLKDATIMQGMWDMAKKRYVLSVNRPSNSFTIVFDEEVKGWNSRFSYITDEGGLSIDSKFFTFKQADLYEHYSNEIHNTFYGVKYDSEIEMLFNVSPSINKKIYSVSYEGSNSWDIYDIETDTDSAADIGLYNSLNNDKIISAFKRHHGKYFSSLFNDSVAGPNEVIFGKNMTGVKGFYLKMKVRTRNSLLQELFAVSINYDPNNY